MTCRRRRATRGLVTVGSSSALVRSLPRLARYEPITNDTRSRCSSGRSRNWWSGMISRTKEGSSKVSLFFGGGQKSLVWSFRGKDPVGVWEFCPQKLVILASSAPTSLLDPPLGIYETVIIFILREIIFVYLTSIGPILAKRLPVLNRKLRSESMWGTLSILNSIMSSHQRSCFC